MDGGTKKEPLVFALEATNYFGKKMGANGRVYENIFPDGEPYARPDQDIRGADVFVVQSLHDFGNSESVSDKILKLVIFCNAAHHASARRITAVLPYLAFSRQDRKTESRGPISAQALSRLLQASFVDRLLTMDPHNPAIQSAYSIPSDILPPFRPLVESLYPSLVKERKVGLVSPDVGALKERIEPLEKRITQYFEGKPPFELVTGFADKRRRSGSTIDSVGFFVYGDLKDAFVIIPDDESATGRTMENAAARAKGFGAKYVVAAVVHNKLNDDAAKNIQNNPDINEFLVTDTIYRSPDFFKKYSKFKEVSVADYFKRAIINIHDDRSLSAELF